MALQKTGAAAFHGLWTYYNDSEVRDAVNSAIIKYAPQMRDKLLDKGAALASDPDKAGRMTGRFAISRGISNAKDAESSTKFFLSVMAGIGNLDRTGKDWKSKLNGLVFGADYANRSRKRDFDSQD